MKARLAVAHEIGLTLYVVSAAVASGYLYLAGGLTFFALVGALMAPFAGVAGLVLSTLLVPAIAGDGRFERPLHLTLPILFPAWMQVVVRLGMDAQMHLVRPSAVLDSAFVWRDVRLVLASLLMQLLVLSLLVARQKPTPSSG